MAAFADMLSYLRKREGLSQVQLAQKTGLTRSAIGMYETGKREPDFETLEIFADFFNVNMDTLMGKAPISESERPVTDDDIKFALWGTREIDDDVLDQVKAFAKFARENRKDK